MHFVNRMIVFGARLLRCRRPRATTVLTVNGWRIVVGVGEYAEGF